MYSTAAEQFVHYDCLLASAADAADFVSLSQGSLCIVIVLFARLQSESCDHPHILQLALLAWWLMRHAAWPVSIYFLIFQSLAL